MLIGSLLVRAGHPCPKVVLGHVYGPTLEVVPVVGADEDHVAQRLALGRDLVDHGRIVRCLERCR